MNRFFVLSIVTAFAILMGCDPFGTDETSVYLTGTIYEDVAHNNPAEGVTVIAHGDSVNTYDIGTETDASGVFWIEMPVYPTPGAEGTGYSLPGYAKLGLSAHWGSMIYVYSDITDNPFSIEVGDTLDVWDTDLESWGGGL